MKFINPRSKLFWHLDKLQEIKLTGRTKAPVNVEVDLSNVCSRGCIFCHFAYTHTRGPLANKVAKPEGYIAAGDLMPFDLAISMLDQLKDSGVQSLTFTGGGEPTLHPRFDAIAEYASSVGLHLGLYSHGGHINKQRAALIKSKFTFVYISLDECTREDYKAVKGVNGYDAVIEGITNLVAAKGDCAIGVGFLLTDRNCRQIYHMVQLGKSLGVDYVQFRPIINYDQAAPAQLTEDAAWITEAIQLLQQYTDDPFVMADVERFRMYRDWQGHGYKTCNWAALQTVITPNGKVWRCVNRRGHSGALLGDLTQDSFAEIWARSGGTCAVDGGCRILCRGHISNVTLDAVMTTPVHENFI